MIYVKLFFALLLVVSVVRFAKVASNDNTGAEKVSCICDLLFAAFSAAVLVS